MSSEYYKNFRNKFFIFETIEREREGNQSLFTLKKNIDWKSVNFYCNLIKVKIKFPMFIFYMFIIIINI